MALGIPLVTFVERLEARLKRKSGEEREAFSSDPVVLAAGSAFHIASPENTPILCVPFTCSLHRDGVGEAGN